MTMKQLELMLLAHAVGVTLAAPFSARNETVKTKSFVPILKQIYEFRPDGSYSFGYESGDGSFRYETRDPQGQVQGNFGYVDSNGLLRVVEYMAGSTGYRIRWENISTPLIYNQTTDSSTQVPTTSQPQLLDLPVADDADNAISDDHLADPVLSVDHSVADHVQSTEDESWQSDTAQGNGTAPHASGQAENGSSIEPFNGSDVAPPLPSDGIGDVELKPVNGTELLTVIHLQEVTRPDGMSTNVSATVFIAPTVVIEETWDSQLVQGNTVNGTGWPDVLHPNGTLEISGNITNLSFSILLTEPPEIAHPHGTQTATVPLVLEQQASIDEAGDPTLASSWLAANLNGSTGAAIDIPPVDVWAEATGGTNGTPQNLDQVDHQETILTGAHMTAAINQTTTFHDRVSLLLSHLSNKPLVQKIFKLFG